jgi:hypothetical protein
MRLSVAAALVGAAGPPPLIFASGEAGVVPVGADVSPKSVAVQ